jgi:hypothetical protein
VKISKRKLSRSTSALDPAPFRELVDTGQVVLSRALVVREGTSHFEIVDGGADVLVDVQLMPSGQPCTARLGGLGGGPGRGCWAIPPVGAEVIVGVPRGSLEAGVVILACESTGQVPDGLGETTYVVCVPAGGQLLVHDGSAGAAVSLATRADLQAVVDELEVFRLIYNAHTHLSATPGNPTAVPVALHGAASPTPPEYPSPAGTTVLKGK